MQKNQVLIMGAGIPGLSLALILARAGIAVAVIDKNALPTADHLKPSARTTALMQGSLAVLERAGVWPQAQEFCTRLERLSIIDDSTFPRGADKMIREDFDAAELGLNEFGYNVPLLHMTVSLADHARAHDLITVRENTELTQDDPLITQADMIVGADGRHSAVRQWAGIEAETHAYDQSAITCVIAHSLPHDQTSVEFHRLGGPCTFVPHGDRHSAVVWVEKTSDAQDFLTLPKDAFIAAIQDRSRGILGQIQDLVVNPESWPLMTLKAKRLIAPKTALIAEAAHVLSPIGAQGLNLSLRDVAALADQVIAAHHRCDNLGGAAVLKAYERNRRRDLGLRHKGVHLLNRAVAQDHLVIRGARRLGLRALRYVGPLRHILMQEGLSPRV